MSYLLDRYNDLSTALEHRLSLENYCREFLAVVPADKRQALFALDRQQYIDADLPVPDEAEEHQGLKSPLSGIGSLLDEAVMHDIMDNDFLLRPFLASIEGSLGRPEFAASAISRRLFHEAHTKSLIDELSNFQKEAEYMETYGDEAESDKLFAPKVGEFVGRALEIVPRVWLSYDHFLSRARIAERHTFATTPYVAYLNEHDKDRVFRPIDILIAEAVKQPRLLYEVTPRTLETIVAEVFGTFGFNVELTARTRDGGKDIVCFGSRDDISLKFAIEVKRYSEDNPVTVELVRSFVGANHQIHANKLIFVTTSRYTRDARAFANDPFISNLLELKELPDLIQWCTQCTAKRYGSEIFGYLTPTEC